MNGTVKSFTEATGYGSIKTETGTDLYFASSALTTQGAKRSPSQGARVQYEIVQESGHDFATKVVLL